MKMATRKNMAFSLSLMLGAWYSTPTFAQDCTSWDKYPQGEKAAKEQHGLYRDQMRIKNYKEAFKYWEPLFQYVTTPAEAKTRHLDDGIQIYQEFAKAETDPAKKKEYIAKMNALYEHKVKCIGETSYDRSMQGYWQYFLQHDVNETIKTFERSIELGKNETSYYSLTPLATLAVYMYQQKDPKFTNEYMIKLYETLKGIADFQIKQNKNNQGATYQGEWDKVKNEYKRIDKELFGCDYWVKELEPAFDPTPDSVHMLKNKEIMDKLFPKCGAEHPLYKKIADVYTPWKKAEDDKKAEREFDKLTYYERGAYREGQSKHEEAMQWFEKAFDNPKDAMSFPADITEDKKGDMAYKIAYSYFDKGSYSTARTWCRKASSHRPNWGEPYLLVGSMYASSGKQCDPAGVGNGWDAQVVVWAAMDEWSKAKSVDPAAADKANQLIGKYRNYLPEKKEGFMRSIKEGSSYSIGCWIGVTTTVRFK